MKALAVGRNTTGISVRNEERREIDGRLENDGELEERVQAEKLHRELFYQVLKDLTLMILTDAHEYARVYVSKDSYSNKYNEQDRQQAQASRAARRADTSRSEAKIDANAATIISRISRASKNVHGKSRESRKRRVVMAEQKKEHKKKRTATRTEIVTNNV